MQDALRQQGYGRLKQKEILLYGTNASSVDYGCLVFMKILVVFADFWSFGFTNARSLNA